MIANPEHTEARLREAFAQYPGFSVAWTGDEPVFYVARDDEETGIRIEELHSSFDVTRIDVRGARRPVGTFNYPEQIARAVREYLA